MSIKLEGAEPTSASLAMPIVLRAPFEGWAVPISEIPDLVFSTGMLGNGIGIDPTGTLLCAPCDGVVTMLHRAHHALTLASTGGPDILMHIGLDTVSLNGEGFTVYVREGQTVATGDPLIGFDLDLLARHARSLVSPIIVMSPKWAMVRQVTDGRVRKGDVVMEITPVATPLVPGSEAGKPGQPVMASMPSLQRDVVIDAETGIHARPAGRIAECAGRFNAETSLSAHAKTANARSPTSVMALGVQHGDTVSVSATGNDAQAAIGALCKLLSDLDQAPHVPLAAAIQLSLPQAGVLQGVEAAPGMAVGRTLRLKQDQVAVQEPGAGVAVEQVRLTAALDAARIELLGQIRVAGVSPGADILRAHLAFMGDPELFKVADALLLTGKSAGFSWLRAVDRQTAALQGAGIARIAERIDDLRDVSRRVLLKLEGRAEIATELPPQTILIEDELLPSQLIGLDLSKIVGICTASGGPTSHVAILAASHGIPALVAVGPALLQVPDGTLVLLDAGAGTLRLDPSVALLQATEARIAVIHATASALRLETRKPCRMADGTPIQVVANLGGVADVELALSNGAEGCGLLRSEFLFLGRETAPSEDEQHAAYQAIAAALEGRPLIIRTLDPGADKVLPYLGLPQEANPQLGLRGIRMSLWRPEILRTQLRAILRVEPAGQCRIMLPMIATLDELQQVRGILDTEKSAMGRADQVQLGIMIEVPSAALMADLLAAEADFFSVGTNDLTQYTLAMDRGNPSLARHVDAFHPAVLRLIARAAEGAALHKRWIGVCGSLASNPLAAPVLIGLGVTELSATATTIPRIKALVSSLTMQVCRNVAQQALALSSSEAVRALLTRQWPEA